MKDALGDRIKSNFEDRTRYYLPRRTYTILRLDGCHFHTYTKGLKRPFDYDLISDMDNATIAIMKQIQGAVFAYVQSDEISILLTDFATEGTNAWFDGNVQKITSVSASLITAEFNRLRMIGWMKGQRYTMRDENDNLSPNRVTGATDLPIAYFDSRVFTIPDRTEVMNYFRWRNQDCARNSVSMVAQSLYSHHELDGKNTAEKQELIFIKSGINWANYSEADKNGRVIIKISSRIDNLCSEVSMDGTSIEPIMKSIWVSNAAWKFTNDNNRLLNMIPVYDSI